MLTHAGAVICFFARTDVSSQLVREPVAHRRARYRTPDQTQDSTATQHGCTALPESGDDDAWELFPPCACLLRRMARSRFVGSFTPSKYHIGIVHQSLQVCRYCHTPCGDLLLVCAQCGRGRSSFCSCSSGSPYPRVRAAWSREAGQAGGGGRRRADSAAARHGHRLGRSHALTRHALSRMWSQLWTHQEPSTHFRPRTRATRSS